MKRLRDATEVQSGSHTNRIPWKEIVKDFPGRSSSALETRWKEVIDPRLTEKSWTKAETERLMSLVESWIQYVPGKSTVDWKVIRNEMGWCTPCGLKRRYYEEKERRSTLK